MALQLDSGVSSLVRLILQLPEQSTIFIPTLDRNGSITSAFELYGMYLSCLATRESYTSFHWKHEFDKDKYSAKKMCIVHPKPELIKPEDRFQFAFGLPPFHDDASPIPGNDELREYVVSQGTQNFQAPLHLMCLEAMASSVLPGCCFAAVLPRKWIGSRMKYMKWWNNNFALVAKIGLPSVAIRRYIYKDSPEDNYEEVFWDYKQRAAGPLSPLHDQSYSLFIWHKSLSSENHRPGSPLHYLTQRYSVFTARLSSLLPEQTERVAKKFRRHDWFRLTINEFNRMVKKQELPTEYHIDRYGHCIHLADPGTVRTLRISDTKRPVIQTKLTVSEIKADPYAVHIKPVMPVKVCAYSLQASALLQELRNKAGFDPNEMQRANREEGYQPQDRFTAKLKSLSFTEQREWLLKSLCDAGLTPYLTEQDVGRVKAEEKWLNIQLTPIKRAVQVPNEEEGDLYWDVMYDDVDIKAVFPKLWDMWEKRARKMKLDKVKIEGKNVLYPEYQYEDVITTACKQSILNSNVMGLGKTREELLATLLRCQERSLIVVPSRLVGVWQIEIEDTIANYVRQVPRNWMGKVQNALYRIINYAADTRRENLRTFNIVSYETLAKVPKDAMFFQCQVCKFVVCSPKGIDQQQCPKCNHERTKKQKEMNVKAGLRKRKLFGGQVIDERISSGNPVWMMPLEHHWDKVKQKPYQVREFDSHTGRYEMITYFKEEEKKLHLKWTFANLLRHAFTCVIVEEANYVANPDTNRFKALQHITARSRHGMTGTPVRGYPKSICNILNFIFRRSVLPDYRPSKGGDDGVRKFERKYATFVDRGPGEPKKLIPKINQPELFQQELAPFMLRHTRFEPNVSKAIPPKLPEITYDRLEMDAEHRAFYGLWLEKFAEWWMLKRKEEDGQEGAKLHNDIMVKLLYLVGAANVPHFMMDNLKTGEGAMWAAVIGKYKGPMTRKFKHCTRMIEHYIAEGDKTIVFTNRLDNLSLGTLWCDHHKPEKIHSLRISGSVSNAVDISAGKMRSAKQEVVDQFCERAYHVLWASTKTMKEGFNIPQANRGIFLDYTWEPADWEQAIGRMLRPKQRKVVHGKFLTHLGTVDDFMAALVQLKHRSSQEGVDYQAFSDFTVEMIPDVRQYADAIVDGTEAKMRTMMWEAVSEHRKRVEEGERREGIRD